MVCATPPCVDHRAMASECCAKMYNLYKPSEMYNLYNQSSPSRLAWGCHNTPTSMADSNPKPMKRQRCDALKACAPPTLTPALTPEAMLLGHPGLLNTLAEFCDDATRVALASTCRGVMKTITDHFGTLVTSPHFSHWLPVSTTVLELKPLFIHWSSYPTSVCVCLVDEGPPISLKTTVGGLKRALSVMVKMPIVMGNRYQIGRCNLPTLHYFEDGTYLDVDY